MAKLRRANASTYGARKPPGPKERGGGGAKVGENNGQATHGADLQIVVNVPRIQN